MNIKEFIEHFTNTLKCYGCNIEELIQQPDMDYNIEVKDTFDSAFNVDIGYAWKIENNFESVSMLVINFSDIPNYGVAYNITNWGYIDLYIALINMGYNKLFMKLVLNEYDVGKCFAFYNSLNIILSEAIKRNDHIAVDNILKTDYVKLIQDDKSLVTKYIMNDFKYKLTEKEICDLIVEYSDKSPICVSLLLEYKNKMFGYHNEEDIKL